MTTAAATTIPVSGSYVRDPALAGVKEPSREAVLRTKVLLEAGFLASRLKGDRAHAIEREAQIVLAALEAGDPECAAARTATLARACEGGWRAFWTKGRRIGS